MNDTPRRRRNPEARREEILRAAVKLFAERGYARTTTREIAQEAGIAEGTIYKYFTSKQELLFAILGPTIVEPLARLFESGETVDDIEVIRAFMRDRFALWNANRDLVKAAYSEALFNPDVARATMQKVFTPIGNVVGEYIAHRVHEGKFRRLNPAIAVRALIGLMFANFLLWDTLLQDDAMRIPEEKLIEEFSSLFLYGIVQRTDVTPPRESS